MADFKQFDIVSDHSDHHYNNKEKQGHGYGDCFINNSCTVYKRIMREWNILENSLPDTIYVRVYEKRVDLMRAMIVGAAGTPYHDGLFFFDIKFPPDYPNRPPHVRYWSYGLCLSPNLFPSGDICLSLLNTWVGSRNERWVPSKSTILQLLVSLQALVLIDKPYMNSLPLPFYVKSDPMDAFIETCKLTMYLLRNPPEHFKGFIAEHFRRKSSDILRAYIAYANGRVEVGHYYDKKPLAENGLPHFVLLSFQITMKEQYPLLVHALKNNGFSADWVKEDLIVQRTPVEPFTWPLFWSRQKLFFQGFAELIERREQELFLLPSLLPWAANDDDGNDHDDVELIQLTSKAKLD